MSVFVHCRLPAVPYPVLAGVALGAVELRVFVGGGVCADFLLVAGVIPARSAAGVSPLVGSYKAPDCLYINIPLHQRYNTSHIPGAYSHSGPAMNSMNCPGNAKKALTIGSIDKENKIATFSSRGSKENSKPDFVASGMIQIGRLQMLGTSISAPLVSGSIALLISKHNINYEKLFKSLKGAAEDLGFKHYEQGFGKIRIDRAFEEVS